VSLIDDESLPPVLTAVAKRQQSASRSGGPERDVPDTDERARGRRAGALLAFVTADVYKTDEAVSLRRTNARPDCILTAPTGPTGGCGRVEAAPLVLPCKTAVREQNEIVVLRQNACCWDVGDDLDDERAQGAFLDVLLNLKNGQVAGELRARESPLERKLHLHTIPFHCGKMESRVG
jgi:hypothetical protein